jgi:hypothetical protein
VEAHSRHGAESWYEDDEGLVLAQPVATDLTWSRDGVEVKVALRDGPPRRAPAGRAALDVPDPAGPPDAQEFNLTVEPASPVDFTLRVRVPWWVAGEIEVAVDGERIPEAAPASSWLTLRRRWTRSTVRVRLPRLPRAEPLPDRPDTYAFLDGPVVLAGLVDSEVELRGDPGGPTGLLSPDDERAWDAWTGRWRVVGQPRSIRLVPLHEVTDEPFAVYFPIRP